MRKCGIVFLMMIISLSQLHGTTKTSKFIAGSKLSVSAVGVAVGSVMTSGMVIGTVTALYDHAISNKDFAEKCSGIATFAIFGPVMVYGCARATKYCYDSIKHNYNQLIAHDVISNDEDEARLQEAALSDQELLSKWIGSKK